MALLQSELDRMRYELGFNLMQVGAEPYIGVTALFDQIVGPYLRAGTVTTANTVVAATNAPTSVAITLASATGIAARAKIVVDVDSAQELATIQSLVGNVATVLLSKAHTGTYPVTVEGGESIIRELLQRISDTKQKMASAYGAGSLKQVDEIQFYGTGDQTYFGVLGSQLAFWRDELASAIGIQSAWAFKRGGAQRLAVY